MANVDWKLTHEPFNGLESSTEFEERYVPVRVTIKQEDLKQANPPLSPAGKRFVSHDTEADISSHTVHRVKMEKKAAGKSKKPISPPSVIKHEVPSDQESSKSGGKAEQPSRIPSSEETSAKAASQEINNNQEDEGLKSTAKKQRTRRKSATWSKKKAADDIQPIEERRA